VHFSRSSQWQHKTTIWLNSKNSPADSGELPSCVQHLVQGMQVGEAALFWVESTAAFGKKGNGGKVWCPNAFQCL